MQINLFHKFLIFYCFVTFNTNLMAENTLSLQLQPPRAKIVPEIKKCHGIEWIDNYAWIKSDEDPEVLSYVIAENLYTTQSTKHLRKLQTTIYKELLERNIKDDGRFITYHNQEYQYYTKKKQKTAFGLQLMKWGECSMRLFSTLRPNFPLLLRYTTESLTSRNMSKWAPLLKINPFTLEIGDFFDLICRSKSGQFEEILFDTEQLALGKDNFSLETFKVNPQGNILAILYDEDGSMRYHLAFKDIEGNILLPDHIDMAGPECIWSQDGQSIFYLTIDSTMRTYQVKLHRLNTPILKDLLIYQEDDPLLFLQLSQSADKSLIFINSLGQNCTEVRYLEQVKNETTPHLLKHKEEGIQYFAERAEENAFFLNTNQNAKNFRILKINPKSGKEQVIIAHSEKTFIESFQRLQDYLVLKIRKGGVNEIRVVDLNHLNSYYDLAFAEPTYSLDIMESNNFSGNILRFAFSSPITPKRIVDYNVKTKKYSLVKIDPAEKWFDANQYSTQKIFAISHDKSIIPISLFYKKGIKKDGKNPLYLMGYGAYNCSYDPSFSPDLLSLVDRGVIIAIAHIRGGGEFGIRWYEEGKGLLKKNTFYDFIACAEHLIKEHYTSSQKLLVCGGSAGGLLVGCVVNWRPELFKAAIASVPFVDVLNDMLDPSKPWTTCDYNEWGDPALFPYFEVMRSYSPYDNISLQNYPSMLITGGLHDTLVSFCEPTRWVAKLRANKLDNNPLYLKIDMKGGHRPRDNLQERLIREAFKLAFALDQMGISK